MRALGGRSHRAELQLGAPAAAKARTARCAVEDTVVEIGASSRELTVVYAGTAPTTPAVAVRPVDPPLTVPGYLVAPATGPDECLAALTEAFGAEAG